MAPAIELGDFDAVLFDLDGVLTTTRAVHAAAWKHSFDEFLAEWDTEHDTRTARFDESADYTNYVGGKPRQGRGARLPRLSRHQAARGRTGRPTRGAIGMGPRQPEAVAGRRDIEEHQVTYTVRRGNPVTASHYGQ
jgi:phosphoglycolate phosphatase-like HAD superfamily hydrolase